MKETDPEKKEVNTNIEKDNFKSKEKKFSRFKPFKKHFEASELDKESKIESSQTLVLENPESKRSRSFNKINRFKSDKRYTHYEQTNKDEHLKENIRDHTKKNTRQSDYYKSARPLKDSLQKNNVKLFNGSLQSLKQKIESLDPKKVYILPISGYGILNCNMTAILHEKKITIIDAGSYTDLPDTCTLITDEYLNKQIRKASDTSPILQLLLGQKYALEAVFITHNHADHIGGIHELALTLQEIAGLDVKNIPLYIGKYAYQYSKKDILFKNVHILEDKKTTKIAPSYNVYSYFLNHSSLYSIALYFNLKNKKILFLPDHRIDYYPCEGLDNKIIDQMDICQIQKEINKENPDCVILEATRGYTSKFKLNQSEQGVCLALKNYICYLAGLKETIIVSTYATNPMRLRAVFEAAKRSNRLIAGLGGSMANGIEVMFKLNLLDPEYKKLYKKFTLDLREINANKSKYIILATGHMGENNSGIKKLLKGTIHYNWSKNDAVLLSSTTIPKEVCVYNRLALTLGLKARRLLLIDGDTTPELHTSGHLANQDYVVLLNSFKNTKKYIINHGDSQNIDSLSSVFRTCQIPDSKIYKPLNFELVQV